MRLIFLSFLIGCTIISCSIETETHFSKDFGGSQLTTIDLKEMMSLMSTFGGSGEDGNEFSKFLNQINDPSAADSIAMMETKLNEEFEDTGAANFNLAFDQDGKMQVSFDFESLETFQKLREKGEMSDQLGGQVDSGMGGFGEMFAGMAGASPRRLKKWLIIPILDSQAMNELMGNGSTGEEDMDMMMGFLGGMTIKNTYSFERTIKKMKCDIPVEQVGNKITIDYTLKEMMDWIEEGKNGELRIKLR